MGGTSPGTSGPGLFKQAKHFSTAFVLVSPLTSSHDVLMRRYKPFSPQLEFLSWCLITVTETKVIH